MLFAILVNAQVKGRVTDEKNNPISGVTVKNKASKATTVTDFDGQFSIKATANDVLVFSNIGYGSKEQKVGNNTTLNISLTSENSKLEEVVINVGYGTQKQKNLTNSISSIKNDAFDDRPLYNVGQAIQGNAAGVQVVQPSGKPGVGLNINIRGLNSIQSGVNPLYVIDGIQTYDSSGVNTEDILDIQILKDATATAIYGVNGSAGVVLITTKRGKANRNQFNFSTYIGFSKVAKNIDVLNMEQYKTLMTETGNVGDANNPLYTGINTNWSDEVFQTGQDKNVDFSYAGGTDKMKAYASLGYQEMEGVVSPAIFKRLSGKINLDIDGGKWLKAHVNMNLIHTNTKNTSDNTNANYGGVILSALTTQPFLPIYSDQLTGRAKDASGNYADGYKDGQFTPNPLASLENPVAFQSRQDDTETYRYLGNVSFDVNLAKNLVWKPASTIDMSRSVNEYFVDAYRSSYGRSFGATDVTKRGTGTENIWNNYSINLEHTLNYALKKGDNDFTFLAGSSFQKFNFHSYKTSGYGFAEDLRKLDLDQMRYIDKNNTYEVEREKSYISYFGRMTYNYKGKYLLNGVFRASGSSQLAEGNKWGYFPGISGAWIISNESFLKGSTKISEVKLRGGWGKSGNISGLGEYAWYGLYPESYYVNTNQSQSNYENLDLTWETTTDINLGLDLGFFNNRIKLSTDVFKRNTINLINRIQPGANTSSPWLVYNAGELENKGLEFVLNTQNFVGNFKWNTNFNISFYKNKLLTTGYQPKDYYGPDNINQVQANESLGNFYGYVSNGVNPTTGNLEFKDLNGDGTITPADRAVIGNALPDYTFGLTNNFSYKGLSLDVLVTSSQGNDIYNQSRIDLEGMLDQKNQSTAVLNRWTTPGQITDIPSAKSSYSGLRATAASSRWIEDGSYVRLKSITLAYNFKPKFLGLQSLKLYATAQNVYTWTKYSGFDPEVSAYGGNSGTARGIDYGTYPQVKSYTFGVKASF